MGKSSKKSATKVDSALLPAMSPGKVTKKGKREAEEVIKKEVISLKKQKKDGVEEVTETRSSFVKTQKKLPKKEESSSSEETSSEEEQQDDVVVTKNGAKTALKEKESSDGSEDESSESDGEDESSEESGEEAQKKMKTVSKKNASDESSYEDEEESSEEGEEEHIKTPKKNVTDVEMVDALPTKKDPKNPVTPKSQTLDSTTIFVGNLSFNVEKADVEDFFKDCGEIADVRLATQPDGSLKGYGHIEFTNSEAAQKALQLNGSDLSGRALRLDIAAPRNAYTPTSGKEINTYQKGSVSEVRNIFIRGFDKNVDEDEIKEALKKHFTDCGEITRISVPRTDDGLKGFAYIDFANSDGVDKALEFDQSELNGYQITVEQARPKGDNRDYSSGNRNSGRGRSGGGRFRGRGRGGRGRGRGAGR